MELVGNQVQIQICSAVVFVYLSISGTAVWSKETVLG
jgi:hypothetical protein